MGHCKTCRHNINCILDEDTCDENYVYDGEFEDYRPTPEEIEEYEEYRRNSMDEYFDSYDPFSEDD